MSADSVRAQASFKAKQKLNFHLLSDPGHKTIAAFGAWQQKQFMGRKFMGIVRSSFLIGKTGKIEAVWPVVKAKGHAAEVLHHLLPLLFVTFALRLSLTLTAVLRLLSLWIVSLSRCPDELDCHSLLAHRSRYFPYRYCGGLDHSENAR